MSIKQRTVRLTWITINLALSNISPKHSFGATCHHMLPCEATHEWRAVIYSHPSLYSIKWLTLQHLQLLWEIWIDRNQNSDKEWEGGEREREHRVLKLSWMQIRTYPKNIAPTNCRQIDCTTMSSINKYKLL